MRRIFTLLPALVGMVMYGQVGIGTTTPTVELDIESGASTTSIDINNTAGDGDPTINFQLGGTTTFSLGIDDGDSDKFKIGTTAIGTNTRITIDASGNVGIGTTSPVAMLEISDDAGASMDFEALALTHNKWWANQTLSLGLYSSSAEEARIRSKLYTGGNETDISFWTKTGGTLTQSVTIYDDKLGVNTAAPTYELEVNGKIKFDVENTSYHIYFDDNSSEPCILSSSDYYGYLGTNSTAWYEISVYDIYRDTEYALSDSTVKMDINAIQNPIDKIMQLNGYTYYYNPETHPAMQARPELAIDQPINYGLLAQELEQVFPDMVVFNKERGVYMIRNYEQLFAVLIEGMKEQQKEIELLKTMVIKD